MNINSRQILSKQNVTAFSLSLVVFIFYLLQLKYSWVGLRISGIRGPSDYIDQEAVLKSARCFKEIGMDVYKVNTIPSGCGGFVYSIELLRILNFFQLSNISSNILGVIFMVITTLCLCSIFFHIKYFGKNENLIALFAALSPGIWLLMERGNYDEVIFILTIIASAFLASKFQEFGMILLLVTVLIKFYTLPAFLVVIFFLKRRNSKIFFGTVAIPVTLYTLFLIKQVVTFPSSWYVSFGLKSLGSYIDFFVNERISKNFQLPGIFMTIIGLCFLITSIVVLLKFRLDPDIKLSADLLKDCTAATYMMMLVIFLSCFLVGMNYDYRLIYLAILVSLTPLVFSKNRFRTVTTLSGFGALVLSTFTLGLRGVPVVAIQFAGDIFLYFFVATQLLFLYKLCVSSKFNNLLALILNVERHRKFRLFK
jgi:hypothetical protein